MPRETFMVGRLRVRLLLPPLLGGLVVVLAIVLGRSTSPTYPAPLVESSSTVGNPSVEHGCAPFAEHALHRPQGPGGSFARRPVDPAGPTVVATDGRVLSRATST